MNDEFELYISNASELDAVELQNHIDEHTQDLEPVELTSEPLPDGHLAGDPGLAALLLTYGPQVIPPLVAALAAWIAARRSKKSSSSMTLSITKNGVVYSNVKLSDIQVDASGNPVEGVLTKMLGGAAGGDAAKPAAK